jgi:Cu-processing system ATP-binding protein
MHAIEATDVTKRYGDITALDSLSLAVDAGSTFGLLGTNGAGKTTLFKLLVGHITPDGGSLSVAGRDVATAGLDIRRDIGYLPEHAGFPPSLSGREVLSFHARMRTIPNSEQDDRIDRVLETVGLTDAAERAVDGYSNGMNRRLGLATALLPRPSILLLDEPTAGLDPLGVTAFHRIVRRLREESDLTVILSSHVMTEVEELCDSVAVLHDGRLRASGTVTDLRTSTGVGHTVSVWVTETTAVSAVTDLAAQRGCDLRGTDGTKIELRCEDSAVPELLERLTDLDDVTGYEVTEPGLDSVFEGLADDTSDGHRSDTIGDDRSTTSNGHRSDADVASDGEVDA